MKYWSQIKILPQGVWILSFSLLINRMGTMALPFLVLFLTKNKNLSAQDAGLLLGLYGFTSLFIGPISGKIGDKIGFLRIMLISLFFNFICIFIFPFMNSFASMAVVIFLWATFNESFRPANMSLIGDLVPKEQLRAAFALIRLAANLGMSIGPAIGGIIANYSFDALFYINSLFCFFAFFAIYFSKNTLRQKNEHQLAKEAEHTNLIPNSFYKNHQFLYFLLGSSILSLIFFQHEGSMSLFMDRELGLDAGKFGLMFTVNTLLIIAFEIPLTLKTAHWSIRKNLYIGALLFGIGFGSMAFSHNIYHLIFSVCIWTFGEMILFPANSAYVNTIAPQKQKAFYMGLYGMTFNIGMTFGPWLGISILETYGSKTLWLSCFAISLISILIFSRVKEKKELI